MAIETINLPEGPDPVLAIATEISNLSDAFFGHYTALFNLVENELAACWVGKDFDSFKEKVNQEKQRFDEMRDILVDYSTKLRNAVNDHVTRVEDTAGQVESAVSFS